jgi:hypothetical protein
MSDRDENPLYESASKSSNKLSSLKFLDPLYIIGEEGAFFKVAQFKQEDLSGNVLKNPKNIGYVDKSTLILWKKAIYNDKGFVKKALSIVKGAALLEKGKYMTDKNDVKCYSFPEMNPKYLIKEPKLRIFRFLYIVKENPETKMVLLADQPEFGISTQERLLGWVPLGIVQPWEDRMCLEPNFTQDAIDERRLKGVYSSLFISKNGAQNFQKDFKEYGNTEEPDSLVVENTSREPWKRYKKRLPILNQFKEDKIYKTGYTTPIRNFQTGEKVMDETEWESLADDATKRKILLRNVNIVFVIDGSAALNDYMTSITNAIAQIKKDFTEENKRITKFKYGVVVYRNNEDVNCPNVGDVSISKSPLSDVSENVLRFIERESKITGCNDNIYSKALYKGLLEGLNMFNTKIGVLESNYMILIGGAGEKPQDDEKNAPTLKKINELYVKTGVNMFAFQYRRLKLDEYRGFTAQVQNILQTGNEGILNDAKDFNKKGEKIIPINWKRLEEEGLNSYKAIEDENFVKYAEFTWPQSEGNIPEEFFLKQMDGFISQATSQSNELIKKIDYVYAKGSKAPLDNSMRVILKGMNITSDEERKKILGAFDGSNSQLFAEVYAPLKVEGLKYDLYRHVFFFTDDELKELLAAINKLLVSDENLDDTRTALYNAMVELARDYVGASASEAKNMDLDKLLTYIVGMDQHSNIFNSIGRLVDILDVKKVSDPRVVELTKTFKNKYDQLKNLRNSETESYQEDIDIKVFWVPLNYLP